MKTTEMSNADLDEAIAKITDKAAAGIELTQADERNLAKLERAEERRNKGRW